MRARTPIAALMAALLCFLANSALSSGGEVPHLSEVIEVPGFEGIDVRISRTGNAGTVVLKRGGGVVFRYAPSGSAVLWDVERLELDEYENPVLVVVWLTGVRALELVVFDPAKLPEPIVLTVHSADVLERQVEGGRLRIELTETKEDKEGDWEEVPAEVVWPPVPPRIEEGGE